MRKLLLFLIPILVISKKLYAEDNKEKKDYYYPYISGSVLLDGTYDRFLEKNDGFNGDNRNLTQFSINNSLMLHITKGFKLRSNIVIRPVGNRINKNDRIAYDFYGKEDHIKRKSFITDYGLLAEELAFEYHEEYFYFGAGKFNPTFGLAYENNKYYGVLGKNLVNEYKPKEMLGLYTAMKLPMMITRVNFFHRDISFFSGSFFKNRGIDKAKYGLGNTGNLWNWSITGDFLILDNIKMNIGYQDIGAKKINSEIRERSVVVGGEMIVNEGEMNLGYAPSAEAVYMNNYQGQKNRHTVFGTINLPFFYGGWNFGTNYTIKIDSEKDFKTYLGHLLGVGIGYTFKNGIMVDFGRKFERDIIKISATDKEKLNLSSWSVRISYQLKFND